MIGRSQLALKRAFDLILALLILPVFIGPILILIILSSLDVRTNGLFVQKRIGQHGLPFSIYKIRTLKKVKHPANGFELKATRLGSFMRRTKLDELPQIFNIILGQMSFVGPRPDIVGFADQLVGIDRIILKVKPGVTGLATLKYRNEETLLDSGTMSETQEALWKDKVRINRNYVENWSFYLDLQILIRTISMKKYE